MTSEQIIERILSKHQEVSREQIEERLVREKRRTNGLISDSILLRMIAGEFGLDFQNDETPVPTLSVADLISGLGNVTVVGRVVAVFTPRTFNRIRSGKFASFLIADKNSIIRVVLWNSKTNLVESGEIKVGQVVRVFHAYTKEGRAGVELHAGESCSVEVNPQDVDANDYPTISKFVTRIADLTHLHKNRKVNVSGAVKKLFSSSTFERQDLSRGKVMRFALADMTGEMSIVAWNDKVDELEPMLKEDTGLRLVNAKVKKATTRELEINDDAETYVEALPQIEEFMRIADLKEG